MIRWWPLMACFSAVPALWASDNCTEMKSVSVAAAQIGLPTRGAIVLSVHRKRTYCELHGEIRSIDPAADPIRFELTLPTTWNGKAAQFGGGAFDGFIPNVASQPVLGDKATRTPLQHGFATFASDSGHHHRYLFLPNRYNALKAEFALNDEQRLNFASQQRKKTHDTAVALIQSFYGRKPARMYFLGGSTGGREAMMAVDKFPADYDGVLAAYAAWNQIESDLQFIRVSRALYAPGKHGEAGWLSSDKTKLVRKLVLDKCDAADGLRDGIVSNPAACMVDLAPLRCPAETDRRGCFSAGQIRTIQAFSKPQVSTFSVRNSMSMEPGYNVLRGADLTGSLGLCRHPEKNPKVILNSFYYLVAEGVLRYFLTKDPQYNALLFNPSTGIGSGKDWVAGIRTQSEEDDASDADLSRFAGHGGKLLLVHGTADTTIPTEASVLLYQRIATIMGPQVTNSFVRLYLIPGFGHGRGVFDAGFNAIATLDAWADRRQTPANLTVIDQGHGARTRPLCEWPTWPRYIAGDGNTASSFACTKP